MFPHLLLIKHVINSIIYTIILFVLKLYFILVFYYFEVCPCLICVHCLSLQIFTYVLFFIDCNSELHKLFGLLHSCTILYVYLLIIPLKLLWNKITFSSTLMVSLYFILLISSKLNMHLLHSNTSTTFISFFY